MSNGGSPGGDGGRRKPKFGKFGARAKKATKPEEPLDYKNVEYLFKFVTPTGKIQSRKRTGFSGQNQRQLARAIKRARFLSLMPFIGRA